MNAGASPNRPLLSDRQRACLEPTKNMMVNAGAGSGKTLLLAKKMGDLFCRRNASGSYQSVENILALTFTRKAAGELRTRVYGELLDRIAETGPGPLRDHLLAVTEKFHAARIFTIHGFASALIRSHPVASGTDPDFEVLDPAREAAAVRSAVRSTLYSRWADDDEALRALLDHWSPSLLRSTLEYLLSHPIELGELVETYGAVDIVSLLRHEQALRWAEFRSKVEGPSGWLSLIEGISDHCVGIIAGCGTSRTDRKKKEKAEQLLAEFVEPVRTVLKADTAWAADRAFFEQVRSKVGRIGEFRWNGPTAKRFLDNLMEETLPWFESLERDEEALQWTGFLLDVARDAHDRLAEHKRRQGALVNDELLIRARELCMAVPKEARGPIRHILVDEFQDTDPIQWETILMLARNSRGEPEHLFLVGDAKQAIYGFRGADHTVTKTARDVLEDARSGAGIERILDENFRSLNAPLEFTNALFVTLFSEHACAENPYDVPHQPLRGMREIKEGVEVQSSVSFLLCDDDGEAGAAEARAVVRFLMEIRNGQQPEFSEIGRKIQAGEPAVGILFRTYASMTPYLGELLRSGLPFSVYHGRNFFRVPEVETLLNLMSWLSNPGDDAALVGVLRSPIIGWTDEDLASLERPVENLRQPLYERLQNAALNQDSRLPSGNFPVGAWESLTRLKKLACHLSLSETLRHALDASMAPLIFSRGVRGAQAEANIEKLLSIVRELEGSESGTPQTIVQSLLDMSDAGPGEAEAETSVQQRAAIQVMTVHAAKGLEFPLVIPASTGTRRRPNSWLISKRITLKDEEKPGGLSRLTLSGIDFPEADRDVAPTPTLMKTLLKEHDTLQRIAEEKRLLYVALTRARDHLLIPLTLKDGHVVAPKDSHAEFLVQALPCLGSKIGDDWTEETVGNATVRVYRDTPPDAEVSIEVGFDIDAQVDEIVSASFPAPAPIPRISEMPYPRKMRISVTEIMTFTKCPRRFYLEKFIPGTRLAEGSIGSRDEDPHETLPPGEPYQEAGRSVGTLVHLILEKHESCLRAWQHASPLPEEIREDLEKAVSSVTGGSRQDKAALLSAVTEHLRNIARSGILGEPGPERNHARFPVLREIPFEIEHDGFIVTGAIDRLERLEDGTWSLWDYKTTRLDRRARSEVVREQAYDVQLRFYAWAAGLILGAPISSAGIVFTGSSEDPVVRVSVEPHIVEPLVSGLLEQVAAVMDGTIEAFEPIKQTRHCDLCQCPQIGLC